MSRHARQPQIRSIATRERLIRATLDEMFEVGYHAATTHQIAERARVSRGALLHHFPTRADIILAAMETLLEEGTAEIRATSEAVRDGRVPLPGFVDFLWGLFSGRFFYLSLEMITEARNDPDLRDRMIPVVRHFHEALDGIWVAFCDAETRPAREARIILNLTVCLMRGMGVQTVLRTDPDYFGDLLEAWKALLPQMVGGATGDAMFSGARFRP
ncbi:HTH-type transcriptional regulator CymR [Methylobacterium crusticola]|uniref:HTH-type transcriptional regulator CymR n=1 Tax=Methylobacterium crusticola TaxID=1697972 RepID=A0ABQ4QW00_9HYPH|nr:TetR/AcrR family transcriptional regulator [Methylobacterium crusticola]GJD48940.1 HTH-type transcriptional regulator CymR [Methylobacterium crusticola]